LVYFPLILLITLLFLSNYQRKLLAIYLHHGKSILINVFCDQLMKHESIIQTFKEKFVLYGWDMTYESNKDM